MPEGAGPSIGIGVGEGSSTLEKGGLQQTSMMSLQPPFQDRTIVADDNSCDVTVVPAGGSQLKVIKKQDSVEESGRSPKKAINDAQAASINIQNMENRKEVSF